MATRLRPPPRRPGTSRSDSSVLSCRAHDAQHLLSGRRALVVDGREPVPGRCLLVVQRLSELEPSGEILPSGDVGSSSIVCGFLTACRESGRSCSSSFARPSLPAPWARRRSRARLQDRMRVVGRHPNRRASSALRRGMLHGVRARRETCASESMRAKEEAPCRSCRDRPRAPLRAPQAPRPARAAPAARRLRRNRAPLARWS